MEPSLSAKTERISVPSKVILSLALASKPEPVTFTVVPGGPLDVPIERAEVTVKVCPYAFPTLTG